MPTSKDAEKELQRLLKTLSDSKTLPSVLLVEVQLLGQSLVSESSSKGLAILCLSLYARKVQEIYSSDDDANMSIAAALWPYVQQVFNPPTHDPTPSDDSESCVPFTLLIANLFPFAPAACVTLLTGPITTEQGSTMDPLGVLLEVAELPCPLQLTLAEMLGQAAGSKQGRQMVRDRAMEWLQGAVNLGNGDLSVLCAVALSKLGHEPPTEGMPSNSGPDENERITTDAALANKMIQHVISHRNTPSSCGSAIEGLAVLSSKSYIKELICRTSKALTSIMALSPVLGPRPSSLPQTPRGSMDFNDKSLAPVETALCYGLTVILVNLTSKRPPLSAEDEQMEKLRRMAISGKKGGGELEEDPMESDEAVAARVKAVMLAGVVSALSGFVRADSRGVKEALGRLCLALVEDKSNRPLFIRDGGVKVLSLIIRDLMDQSKAGSKAVSASNMPQATESNGSEVLYVVQALAKLIITIPPHLLFPPPHMTTSLNALSPMYLLLTHPNASLLQTFEALMALTNLASIDPSIATRVLQATITPPRSEEMFRGSGREDTTHIIVKVEELLLADNPLVRRAAAELVCNLVGSSAGIAYYSGTSDSSTTKTNASRARTRLNVLLILTNVEDLPTQLAAGGALAILTESEDVCRLLLDDNIEGQTSKRNVWSRIMGMLEPEVLEDDAEGSIPLISSAPIEPGLVLRAVIILLNLLSCTDAAEQGTKQPHLAKAREAGVEHRLGEIVKDKVGDEMMQPAKEALKILRQNGV